MSTPPSPSSGPAPRISVVIPTLNGARFLPETLASLAAQTVEPETLEVVVCDNGSTDETLDIARSFLETARFGRARLVENRARGIGRNWNAGVREATGAFILLLMQDDLLDPDALEVLAGALDSDPELGLAFGRRRIAVSGTIEGLDSWMATCGDLQQGMRDLFRGGRFDGRDLFRHPRFPSVPENKIAEPSFVMLRAPVFQTVGYFDEGFRQSLDFDFWYRVLRRYPGFYLDREVGAFRRHGAQATEQNVKTALREFLSSDWRLIRTHGSVMPWGNRIRFLVRFGMRIPTAILVRLNVRGRILESLSRLFSRSEP